MFAVPFFICLYNTMTLPAPLVLSKRALHHDEYPVTVLVDDVFHLHLAHRPPVFHRGDGDDLVSFVAHQRVEVDERFTRDVGRAPRTWRSQGARITTWKKNKTGLF